MNAIYIELRSLTFQLETSIGDSLLNQIQSTSSTSLGKPILSPSILTIIKWIANIMKYTAIWTRSIMLLSVTGKNEMPIRWWWLTRYRRRTRGSGIRQDRFCASCLKTISDSNCQRIFWFFYLELMSKYSITIRRLTLLWLRWMIESTTLTTS